MAASASQVSQLRRMIAETTASTYTDDDLKSLIESYPLIDAYGYTPTRPTLTQSASAPPTFEANPLWTATYDLNAAAARCWEEKGSAVASNYDFSADGASISRAQVYDQYMKQARYYAARRSPGTIVLRPEPQLSPRLPARQEVADDDTD